MKKLLSFVCILLCFIFVLSACTPAETPSSIARWQDGEKLTYAIMQRENFTYADIQGAQLLPITSGGYFTAEIKYKDGITTFTTSTEVVEVYDKAKLTASDSYNEFIVESNANSVSLRTVVTSEVKFGAFPSARPISSTKIVKGIVAIKNEQDLADVIVNNYKATTVYSDTEVTVTLYAWNKNSSSYTTPIDGTLATYTAKTSASIIDNEQLLLAVRSLDMSVLKSSAAFRFSCFNATQQKTLSLLATVTSTEYKTALYDASTEFECYTVSITLDATSAGQAIVLQLDKNSTFDTTYYGQVNTYRLIEMYQGHLRFLLMK